IGDWSVTGVQTCALPISRAAISGGATKRVIIFMSSSFPSEDPAQGAKSGLGIGLVSSRARPFNPPDLNPCRPVVRPGVPLYTVLIGRASGWGRGEGLGWS